MRVLSLKGACYDVGRSGFNRGDALTFEESDGPDARAAFGGYRVLHQAGSGVLGPVFRSFDPRHERVVAVKAFRLDLPPERVVRLTDAFRRLASAPSAHPALVPIADVGVEGTTPFVVMPFETGPTLDVLVRRGGAISVDHAMRALAYLAAAIDAAAGVALGHGSLHPRDVFGVATGHDEDIRITGFGIVQALEAAGMPSPSMRRPYVAPERSSTTWGVRADIYSLAVIAHELLTGRRPSGQGDQDGSFAPTLAPQQRVQIRRVLGRALEEDPTRRFSKAAEFLAELSDARTRRVAVSPGAPVQLALPDEDEDEDVREVAEVQEVPQGPVQEVPGVPEVRGAEPLEPALVTPSHPRTLAPIEPVLAEPVLVADPLESREFHFASIPNGQTTTTRTRVPWFTFAASLLILLTLGAVGLRVASRVRQRPAPMPVESEAVTPARQETEVAVSPAVPAASEAAALPPAPPVEAASSMRTPEPAAPARSSAAEPAAAAAPGRLVIRSQPSGAMVRVDGRVFGQTPVTVRDLALGTHTVFVARPGHVPRAEQVTLASTNPSRTLVLALQPGLPVATPEYGAVDVDARPSGARVTVDGRFVGLSPLRISELRPGLHTITIELGGYNPLTSRVVVEAGLSQAYRPVLKSLE